MTLQEKLDELLRVCDSASEGPWSSHRQQDCPQLNCHEIELRNKQGGALYRSTSYGLMDADGRFISVARTEMPRLVRAVKKLVEQRDKLVRDFEVSQTLFYEDTTGERLDTEEEVKQEISELNAEIAAILKGEE